MSEALTDHDFLDVCGLRLRISTQTLTNALRVQKVRLSWHEVAILATLMRRYPAPVTRAEMLRAMYGKRPIPATAVCILRNNVCGVQRLLTALETVAKVRLVRGVGYVLVAPCP